MDLVSLAYDLADELTHELHLGEPIEMTASSSSWNMEFAPKTEPYEHPGLHHMDYSSQLWSEPMTNEYTNGFEGTYMFCSPLEVQKLICV